MDTLKLRLREQGYSINAAGHIECHKPDTNTRDRYAHERCAVIRIEVERDGKETRALVDALIAAADEPRCAVGRTKNGGAVMLFKVKDKYSIRPEYAGHWGDIFKLGIRATGDRVTITVGSEGETVDVSALTWDRAPLNTQRDTLALLFADTARDVIDAAFANGCSWFETLQADRQREHNTAKIREDVASGKLVIKSPEQLHEEEQIRKDAETVALYEGKELSYQDGAHAQMILAARARVADRKRRAARKAKGLPEIADEPAY